MNDNGISEEFSKVYLANHSMFPVSYTPLDVYKRQALQQSLRDLDRGFVNFFQKRAAHKSGSANMGVSGLSYRA